jgi:hypothetical protein
MRAVLPTLRCLPSVAKVSIACSVVSSLNVRLNVLPDGTPLQGVTLVVSLQVNARQVGPPLKTAARGSAELQNLASGTYCITATADPRLGADLCLLVSNGHDHERNEFSWKLVPLPPPPPTLEEQLAQAARLPSQARAREFEGSVTDVTGASISHAKTVVYVLRSGNEPSLISLEAAREGRSSVPLSPGSYSAAFQSPGFRTRFVGFAVGPDEAQKLAPVVQQAGSCT